jgi:cyclohexanone monooxygenase
MASAERKAEADSLDVVIVGAGFSGLYMLHRLRGLGVSARIFEAGPSVGGTWYWNRYPGARVDIESQEYSYSFSEELEKEWVWSERYAAQPELLRYLNHVADRFDLRRDIELDTRVTAAVFDEETGRWTITTDKGGKVSARFCVMATGCLSVVKDADLPGIGNFRGEVYHTGHWPEGGVDLAGKRVGIIGTGSSAIQTITEIAPRVAHLTVFQRTPCFSIPAHNGPANAQVVEDWRKNRASYRQRARESAFGILSNEVQTRLAMDAATEERTEEYERRWAIGGFAIGGAYADLLISKPANDTAAEFVADKIRSIVKNPETAEKLIPKSYPLGSKRICVDTGYYEVFNRDNVALVDISGAPIEEITATGLRTAEGSYAFDVLITAIGFDAMTGALGRIDIRGRGGAKLKDAWAEGPRTYLGLMAAGFPNLFLVTGPGSPSVLSNMVVSIEQHVDWIADCIDWLGGRQLGVIEADPAAQDAWVAHVNEVASMTLFPQAKSWYMGANVPGKPRVFMPYIGGVGAYRQKCDEVAAKGYEGFVLGPSGSSG